MFTHTGEVAKTESDSSAFDGIGRYQQLHDMELIAHAESTAQTIPTIQHQCQGPENSARPVSCGHVLDLHLHNTILQCNNYSPY